MYDRRLVDPENKYDFPGPLRVENVALQLLEILDDVSLERTRDVIQLELREEPKLVLLVTGEAIELRLPITEWTGGYFAPVPSSRYWKRIRVPTSGQIKSERIVSLIEQARGDRAAEFMTCRFCGKSFPTEHRHGDACHGCAERDLGIVH